MSSSLRKASLLVGVSIAAAVGFAGMANATPFGVSEIARNHELDEGAKNHGAIVSEAAKHHGGGVSLLNSQSTFSSSQGISLNSQSTVSSQNTLSPETAFSSPQSVSSPQSIPEPGILLMLSAGLCGVALWHFRSRPGVFDSRR